MVAMKRVSLKDATAPGGGGGVGGKFLQKVQSWLKLTLE